MANTSPIIGRYDIARDKWYRGYWQGTRFYILRSSPVPILSVKDNTESENRQ